MKGKKTRTCLRIVDAELNRAREGLRVLEDDAETDSREERRRIREGVRGVLSRLILIDEPAELI